jgi:hypothetical protein
MNHHGMMRVMCAVIVVKIFRVNNATKPMEKVGSWFWYFDDRNFGLGYVTAIFTLHD